MTPRFKDFGSSAVFDTAALEPVTFRLDGQTFTCRPALPGSTLLSFVAAADSGEGGRASSSIPQLFSHAMEPAEYERFTTFIERSDRIVPIDTLAEIAAWLVEVYSERPTQPPTGSPNGTSTTAPTAEAVASSTGSI